MAAGEAVKPVLWTIPRRPLGAHMSIAGGIDLAVERAAAVGCTALQIFTKSSNQWAARSLPEDEVERFRQAVVRHRVERVVAHDSYLINLCSPDDALWRKSIDACALELARCERLGVPWLVTHPGGHMGRGEEYGIGRMAEAIDAIHEQVTAGSSSLALETTAGQGTVIGHRFEQIAAIIARAAAPARIGVCLDTCHVFAAGYDLRTPVAYAETMARFSAILGWPRLVAVHVNDSKKDLGARVDRHEHIGKGYLGLEAFRLLMNDERLQAVPLVLETPKDETCREDVMNLETLMGLVDGGKARPEGRPVRADAARRPGRPAGAGARRAGR